MRLLVRRPDRAEPVAVTGASGRTVADLAELLDAPALWHDGRRLDPAAPLAEAGLLDGDVVATTPPADTADDGAGLAAVAVVTGRRTGRRITLGAGSHVVGRAPTADVSIACPTVSRRHLRLTVADVDAVHVEDLDSRNGTRLAGEPLRGPATVRPGRLLRLGATTIRIERAERTTPTITAADPAGTTLDHPRRPTEPVPEIPTVTVDGPPAAPDPPARSVGWAMIVAPVVLSLVMAVAWDPRFALFGLLTPVMIGGQWVEGRVRLRRARRRHEREQARWADDVERAADAAAERARDREEQVRPGPAELCTRGRRREIHLWQGETGGLSVVVGRGPGSVPLEVAGAGAAAAGAIIAAARQRASAPLSVDLTDGALGVVGDPAAARGVLRAAALHAVARHGPDELAVTVVTDRPGAWRWVAWLPHARGAGRGVLEAGRTAPEDRNRHRAADRARPDRTGLLVVDAPAALRTAPVTRHLDAGQPAVVRGGARHALPAACRYVLRCTDAHGRARLGGSETTGERALLAAAVPREVAARVGRALAPLRRGGGTGGLAASVSLLDLHETTLDAASLSTRWSAPPPGLSATLGEGADGPVTVDLATDGPHVLVGGTTGSGKSELLRTLLTSAALRQGPDRLTAVLIDYKGGSAFDGCRELPHVAGLVTDLDERLAARALRCLEAELTHREEVLRAAGASDLDELPATGDGGLPRLLVIVDEYATLAADLPEFVDSLVDIAQRGRSLGVHLVLATQRPGAAVTDDIRANTDLRIALRVRDRAGSVDVLGCEGAEQLERTRPGRALLRCGTDSPVALQTALCDAQPTGERWAVRPLDDTGRPSVAAGTQTPAGSARSVGPADGDPLAEIAAAARAAAADLPEPRCPWPPPLPEQLDLLGLGAPNGDAGPVTTTVGRADEPDRQRHVPFELDLREGAVALLGARGSGASRGLAAIGLALARDHHPDRLHVYGIARSDVLEALTGLPHTGAVVSAGDPDRQRRLIRQLRKRSEAPAEGPGRGAAAVLLIDGYESLHDRFDDPEGWEVLTDLETLAREGSDGGVHVVVSADRPGGLPPGLLAACGTRVCLALSDPFGHAVLGLQRPPPDGVPGRGTDVATGRTVQLALPDDPRAVAATVAGRWPTPRQPPAAIDTLPADVSLQDLASRPRARGDGWHLPFAVDGETLTPTGLTLRPGDHTVIAGPARSGRSTTLAAVARLAAQIDGLAPVGMTPRGGPLGCVPDLTVVIGAPELDDWLDAHDADEGATGPHPVVLIDDIDLLGDTSVLERRLDGHRNVTIVAAGRVDTLRRSVRGWTRELTRTGLGVALQPRTDTDGTVWDLTLPRLRQPGRRLPPGRGLLIDRGQARLVQVAVP